MVRSDVFLVLHVLGFGVFFFRLHSLPEHIAHKSEKMQAELVAVLCLISLFTHMHIFWIIGLVLAMIELPDFGGPLNRIAGSAEKLAGLKPGEGDCRTPSRPWPGSTPRRRRSARVGTATKPADGAIPLPARAEAAAKPRERAHA